MNSLRGDREWARSHARESLDDMHGSGSWVRPVLAVAAMVALAVVFVVLANS